MLRVVGFVCLISLLVPPAWAGYNTSGKGLDKCSITISPEPVPLNTPWFVVVSGLKPGTDSLYLGNGWNDGNDMPGSPFTADQNGNVAVSPLEFSIQVIGNQTLDPTGAHYFQVYRLLSNGNNSQLLCELEYDVN